jgi:hypothetical protein
LVIVLIGVFVCLISFVRLVKGIAIIYEVKQLRVGVVSVALILVVLSFMLLYYNYEFSSFAYLKFFLNILNSTK